MVLKNAACDRTLHGAPVVGRPVLADEYRAHEFLGLDLSQRRSLAEAARPGGAIRPRSDRGEIRSHAGENGTRGGLEGGRAQARKIAQNRVEQPRAAARTRLARRPSNPLDAQARDTRIQTWPCKSGAICGWQR